MRLHTQGSQCGLLWLRCPSCRGPPMGWGGQEHYPPFVKQRVGMSNKSHLPLYLWNYSLQGLASIRLDSGNHSRLLTWTHIYSVAGRLEIQEVQPFPQSTLHPSKHTVVSTECLTHRGDWLFSVDLQDFQDTWECWKKCTALCLRFACFSKAVSVHLS